MAVDSRRDGLGSRRPGVHCTGEKNAALPRHARSSAAAWTPPSTITNITTNHRPIRTGTAEKSTTTPACSANALTLLDTQGSFRDGVVDRSWSAGEGNSQAERPVAWVQI